MPSRRCYRYCAAVQDHPGIAVGKMTNREKKVALQAVSLRIVNGLTKKKENARVGEDKMAPHAIVFLAFWLLSAQRSLCSWHSRLSEEPFNVL